MPIPDFVHADPSNLKPFSRAAAIVYIAYVGFDGIATMAEESFEGYTHWTTWFNVFNQSYIALWPSLTTAQKYTNIDTNVAYLVAFQAVRMK